MCELQAKHKRTSVRYQSVHINSHITYTNQKAMLSCDHTLVQHPTQCKSGTPEISVSRRNYAAIFLWLQLEFRHKHAAAHQISPTRNAFEQLVRYGYEAGMHTLVGRFKRS